MSHFYHFFHFHFYFWSLTALVTIQVHCMEINRRTGVRGGKKKKNESEFKVTDFKRLKFNCTFLSVLKQDTYFDWQTTCSKSFQKHFFPM